MQPNTNSIFAKHQIAKLEKEFQGSPKKENQMSHPDPNGPADRRPIKVGEVWETP
jgi:hypothetical protein